MLARPTIDVTSADDYFDSRLRSEQWDAADETSKAQALAQASFLLAGAFTFGPNAKTETDDGDVVWHERVTSAVCEQAIYLLAHDPSAVPDALFQGLSEASAGSVFAKFDKAFVRPWICESAKVLIGDLGTFLSDSTTGSVNASVFPL